MQDNFSRSSHGVLRGLHFQEPNGQGKLLQVLRGAIFRALHRLERSGDRHRVLPRF